MTLNRNGPILGPAQVPAHAGIALDFRRARPTFVRHPWLARPLLHSLLICLIFGGLSIALGADNNWDLRYYHLYAPYAYLHQRYLQDIGPAQYQGFFNPVADLLFYGLVTSPLNETPRLVAFIMGAVHGINAALVLAIARRLIAPRGDRTRIALVAMAWLVGVTGAGFISLLGASTNDLVASIPVLASLFVGLGLVEPGPQSGGERAILGRFVLAGLLAGCAFGLKFTSVIYAPGLAVVALLAGVRRRCMWGPIAFAAAAGAAVVIVAGHHMATLWHDFGNPVFPLLNQIFRSPWWEPLALQDPRFIPPDIRHLLAFPFAWAHLQSYVVSEPEFRDVRAALAYASLLTAGVVSVLQGWSGRERPSGVQPEILRAFVAFVGLSFLTWALFFGIYRYAVGLEMLTGLATVAAIMRITRVRAGRLAGAMLCVTVALTSTAYPHWGRLPFGARYIDVKVPALPANSVVLMPTRDPAAFIIPFAEPTARYLGIENNYLDLWQHNLLTAEVDRAMRTPGRDKFVLSVGPFDADRLNRVVDHYGLELSPGPCRPVETNLAGFDQAICPLRARAGDQRN